jgi:maleate isomerase
MYHDDGWDVRCRIGVLTPHADVGPESELRAMAPRQVAIHAARVPFGAMGKSGAMDPTIPLAPVRAFAEPPGVDEATALLAAAPLSAIAFGFTSSAYVIGADGEREMLARLTDVADGIPVVAPCAASVDALQALAAARIALIVPPWFDAELTELGRRYYESAGIEVADARSCGLPSDQTRIGPSSLFDWIVANAPSDIDAVVVGGNGFRSVGVIDAVEGELGLPLVTANQVLLWAALGAAEQPISDVVGYGRLFSIG